MIPMIHFKGWYVCDDGWLYRKTKCGKFQAKACRYSRPTQHPYYQIQKGGKKYNLRIPVNCNDEGKLT